MKIVCVGYLHGAGGAERQITMLANALAEDESNNLSLVVLAHFDDRYYIDKKVNIIDLSFVENNPGKKIVNRYNAFRKTIIKLEPDVTIHFWVQSVYFSLGIPKELKGKLIYSERGDPGDDEYKGILGIIRNIAFTKVDGFVFQSEGARDYFNKKIVKRSIVIHNPVSVPKEECISVSTRKKEIINVGRLHPQKNQKLLINAFEKISNEFKQYRLVIYGEGELYNELQEQIDSYNLNEQIIIRPPTKDIFSVIREAALFVLSSDYEGMPNVLMEAMALGTPCISTDCRPGGARTLIENGINGMITPLGDSLALAKAMTLLLNDEVLCEKMSTKAKNIVETHSPQIMYKKWKDFINDVFSGKSNGNIRKLRR